MYTTRTHAVTVSLMLAIAFAAYGGEADNPENDRFLHSVTAEQPLATFAAPFECTTVCWDNSNGACEGEDQHVAWDDGNNSHSGLPHANPTSCLDHDCAGGGHTLGCGPDFGALPGHHESVRVRDILDLVRGWPSAYAEYNVERRSLQLFGCEDVIVANLPVSAAAHLVASRLPAWAE